jgi:hypothetical protein
MSDNSRFAKNDQPMAKQLYSFRFDPELIKEIEKLAKKDLRSTTNYIETILKQHLEESKKKPKL